MSQHRTDRRRFRNILLEPRKQLRYATHFFVFAVVVGVFMQWMTYRAAQSVVDRILAQAGVAGTLGPVIDDARAVAVLQSAWLLPVVGISALVYSAALLHRFFGAVVPIRRHIEQLRRGDYSGTCEVRAGDELYEIATELNSLTEALRDRQHTGSTDVVPPRRAGERGFSIIELLAVLAVISIVAMIGVSQFIRAYDRTRQRSTLADMRSISAAAGVYLVDNGGQPTRFADLEPYYIQKVATVDRWGNAWSFESEENAYLVSSPGKDGIAGPEPPEEWFDEPFECDLILRNGTFVQAPRTSGA